MVKISQRGTGENATYLYENGNFRKLLSLEPGLDLRGELIELQFHKDAPFAQPAILTRRGLERYAQEYGLLDQERVVEEGGILFLKEKEDLRFLRIDVQVHRKSSGPKELKDGSPSYSFWGKTMKYSLQVRGKDLFVSGAVHHYKWSN